MFIKNTLYAFDDVSLFITRWSRQQYLNELTQLTHNVLIHICTSFKHITVHTQRFTRRTLIFSKSINVFGNIFVT